MSTLNIFLLHRQTLTLVTTEAGPLETAGKDVAGVVKSIDAKLAAVGIIAEKVKTQCKGCPSVSHFDTSNFYFPTSDFHVCSTKRLFCLYCLGGNCISVETHFMKQNKSRTMHIITPPIFINIRAAV